MGAPSAGHTGIAPLTTDRGAVVKLQSREDAAKLLQSTKGMARCRAQDFRVHLS